MIHPHLDKYIRLVGGLVGRNLSTYDSTLTLDSYNYHGLHTVFHFNRKVCLGFHNIHIKESIKLTDLTRLVDSFSPAYYALKHLQEVLK